MSTKSSFTLNRHKQGLPRSEIRPGDPPFPYGETVVIVALAWSLGMFFRWPLGIGFSRSGARLESAKLWIGRRICSKADIGFRDRDHRSTLLFFCSLIFERTTCAMPSLLFVFQWFRAWSPSYLSPCLPVSREKVGPVNKTAIFQLILFELNRLHLLKSSMYIAKLSSSVAEVDVGGSLKSMLTLNCTGIFYPLGLPTGVFFETACE